MRLLDALIRRKLRVGRDAPDADAPDAYYPCPIADHTEYDRLTTIATFIASVFIPSFIFAIFCHYSAVVESSNYNKMSQSTPENI